MRKSLLKILPLFLMVVVLGIAVAFMPVRKSIREKAATVGSVGIELVPESASLEIGEEKEISIIIKNPEKRKISFADIRMTFDKNVLQMKSFAFNPQAFTASETVSNLALLGNETGIARVVVLNSSANLSGDELTIVGILTIKGKANGSSSLTIIKEQSQVVIENPGSDDLEMAITSVRNGQYAVLGVSAKKVNVKLDPAGAVKTVNQNFTVDVQVEADDFKIGFMQLALDFDKDKLQLLGFTPNAQAFSDGGFSGEAKIFALSLGLTFPTGNFTAGKISLKGKTSGAASLTIKKDQTSYFAGLEENKIRLFNLGTVQGGSYTFVGGTAPVLNFKIKFQGVSAKRADQKVKVVSDCAYGSGHTTGIYNEVNVTADNSGIYSGSVVFSDQRVGAKCRFFIKGPKHLARKFCENNQTARCGSSGQETIILTAGDNNLDFSGLILEAGDLPNPNEGGKQDGVVNSVDFSLIEARVGKTETEALAIADLNLDGIVNWGDVSVLLSTLGTKYEDEY